MIIPSKKKKLLKYFLLLWVAVLFVVIGKGCRGHREEVSKLLQKSFPAIKDLDWYYDEYAETKHTKWRKRRIFITGVIKSDSVIYVEKNNLKANGIMPALIVLSQTDRFQKGIRFNATLYKGDKRLNDHVELLSPSKFLTPDHVDALSSNSVIIVDSKVYPKSLKNLATFEKIAKEISVKIPAITKKDESIFVDFFKDVQKYYKINFLEISQAERTRIIADYDNKLNAIKIVISELESSVRDINNYLRFPLEEAYGDEKYVTLLTQQRALAMKMLNKFQGIYPKIKRCHFKNKEINNNILSGRLKIVRPQEIKGLPSATDYSRRLIVPKTKLQQTTPNSSSKSSTRHRFLNIKNVDF